MNYLNFWTPDVFFLIVKELALRDTINLCQVCKRFYHFGINYSERWKALIDRVYSHVFLYKELTYDGPNYHKYAITIDHIDLLSQAMTCYKTNDDLFYSEMFDDDLRFLALYFLDEKELAQKYVGDSACFRWLLYGTDNVQIYLDELGSFLASVGNVNGLIEIIDRSKIIHNDCLIITIQYGHLLALKVLMARCATQELIDHCFINACCTPYLNIILYLLQGNVGDEAYRRGLAQSYLHGYLHVTEFLERERPDVSPFDTRNEDEDEEDYNDYVVSTGAELFKNVLIEGHVESMMRLDKTIFIDPEEYQEGLFIAAEQGLLSAVKYFINKRTVVDPEVFVHAAKRYQQDEYLKIIQNALNKECLTEACQLALREGELDILRFLLSVENADGEPEVEMSDLLTMDVMVSAIKRGKLVSVEFLLDHGFDLENGLPLEIAIHSEEEMVVQYLVERGATITAGAFCIACMVGNLNIIKYLFAKVSSNKENIITDQVFCIACENPRIEVLSYLVEMGANIHTDEEYGLRFATQTRNLDLVNFFVKRGANIQAKNNEALLNAVEILNNKAIVRYLIAHGADIHAGDDYVLRKYLSRQTVGPNNKGNFIKYLIRKGANVNAANGEPLILTCNSGNLDMMKYLIRKGAALDRLDELMTIAEGDGNQEIVLYLQNLN